MPMSDCNASFESGVKDENEDGSTTSTYSDIQNDKKNRNTFQQSLDLKVKMLNEGALLKKRSPMAGVGNYLRKSEELKDQEFLNVSVTITSKLGKCDTRRLFLKYEPKGSLIFTENCLFDDISLTIDLKSILSIRLTLNELLIATDLD